MECDSRFAYNAEFMWRDAYNKNHTSWAGSSKEGMCGCGELGKCNRCYCYNPIRSSRDNGTFVDKGKLPITFLRLGNSVGGTVTIGDLKCAHQHFDIPSSCESYRVQTNTNGAYHLDTDGSGPNDPFLVYCDLKTYPGLAVTELQVVQGNISLLTQQTVDVNYIQNINNVLSVVNQNAFCIQRVEYVCKNSGITGGRVYVNVGSNSRQLTYFPGANGLSDSCGCGATQSCQQQNLRCDCDIYDGIQRRDLGDIINKSDLPVRTVTGGTNSTENYFVVSHLQCGIRQFGIPANCETLRTDSTGKPWPYTYFIDPDSFQAPGSVQENQAPFLVECVFNDNPAYGITVIHHSNESWFGIMGFFELFYYQVSFAQLTVLKTRSTFCIQNVDINCTQFSLTYSGGVAKWNSMSNNSYVVSDSLTSCTAKGGCNCAGSGVKLDFGMLTAMDTVPITSMNFTALMGQLASNQNAAASIRIGPLQCFELFPTCADLYQFVQSKALLGEQLPETESMVTVDADGAGNAQAFRVQCKWPDTSVVTPTVPEIKVTVSDTKGKSQCFDITYTDFEGDIITPQQLIALRDMSENCFQTLSVTCQNARVSGMVNFTTCDGVTQIGWAGSMGNDSCQCGLTGRCAGGKSYKCHCDLEDATSREDGAVIIHKNQLPVCQVCLSLEGIPTNMSKKIPNRKLQYSLSALNCHAGSGKNVETSCQVVRLNNKNLNADTTQIVYMNAGSPIPVACLLIKDPPVGNLEIFPETQVFRNITGSQTLHLYYYTINMTIMHELMIKNIYCSQKIYFFCLPDYQQEITLKGSDGWQDFDGNIQQQWDSLLEEDIKRSNVCSEVAELCQKCGLPKGYVIYQKSQLPITALSVTLPYPATIVVDSARCSDLYENCYEIMKDGTQVILQADTYTVDPDGAGGVDPMKVKCEFKNNSGCAITVVDVDSHFSNGFVSQGHYVHFEQQVNYSGILPQQVQALANMSTYCFQSVGFSCIQSQLINKNNSLQSHYKLSGQPSLSFGTAENTDFIGCACGITGTCGHNDTCRCDAKSPQEMSDEGMVTSKAKLPVTGFIFANQQASSAMAVMKAGNVRCSNAICQQFPKNCHDALTNPRKFSGNGINYEKSGEYLIHPKPTVCDPFIVYCEMDLKKKIGLTIIIPKTPKNSMMLPGQSSSVQYYGPTERQIRCLVLASSYCIQPVSYECYKAKLLGGGAFWSSMEKQKQNIWGGGLAGTCACGNGSLCGSQDSSTQQKTGKCNCDAYDARWRKDAGVLTNKETLPVAYLNLTALTNNSESRVNFTIGNLTCGPQIIPFDECANDFNDCSEQAVCKDTNTGYTCECRKGWQGLPENKAVANGRYCPDDDECLLNVCPTRISDCLNTPGSFSCSCHAGFKKTGPTSCEDIDECKSDSHNNCDVNANCINQYGTFKCQCHQGFRGSGVKGDCFPVGVCIIFGDPHVISFDGRWSSYQGNTECPLTAVTTNCPGKKRRADMEDFAILYTPWKEEPRKHGMGEFTWLKSLEVHMNGHVVEMLQDRVLIVDGIAQPVGFAQDGLFIFKTRNKLMLKYTLGVDIYWDGEESAELIIPATLMDYVCGICGNYNGNSTDDWIVGPACNVTTAAGSNTTLENETSVQHLTDNENVFGNSWMITTDKCQPLCTPINLPKPCIMSQAEAERQCRKLYDRANSFFKLCLRQLDRDQLTVYKRSCVFDMCRVEQDVTVVLCKYAEQLAKECQLNTQVNVAAWTKQGFCVSTEDTCENGRVRESCSLVDQGHDDRRAESQTALKTCLQLRVPSMGFNMSQGCVDGCFCPFPLLEEGDKCVSENQCGCFYNNTYFLLNQTLTDRNCNESVVCREGGVVEYRNLTCPQNETCTLEDHVVGCHCIPGYFRVGMHCYPDPCQHITCPPNSKCFDGQCQCEEGFVGNCEACQDVDECASDLDDCLEELHERCVNTIGSYHCACAIGYVRVDGICTDEDECALGIGACPPHSQCHNLQGIYGCSCCMGYTFNTATKQCDWKGHDTLYINGSNDMLACCDCNTPECDKPGSVCGSDGVTYPNIRALVIQSCLNGKHVEPMYEGSCEAKCSQVQCLRPYATCKELHSGLAHCGCPTCTTLDIQIINLVCASNNIFYRTKCEFETAMCLLNIVHVIIVNNPARCQGSGGPGPGGIQSGWSNCSSSCGLGTIKKTVTVAGKRYDFSAVCYGSCPNRTCSDLSCGKLHECVEGGQHGATCMCPRCGDQETAPVCGMIGQDPALDTFRNPCELKRAACLRRQDYSLLKNDSCQDEPTDCGVMDQFERRTDQYGCRNPQPVNYRQCKGGCGQWPKDCCYKKSTQVMSVPFVCSNGTIYHEMVNDITACQCIPPKELEAIKAAEGQV